MAVRKDWEAGPRRAERVGIEVRKEAISGSGRKPQKPSKAVMAMAISGLWLSSVGVRCAVM